MKVSFETIEKTIKTFSELTKKQITYRHNIQYAVESTNEGYCILIPNRLLYSEIDYRSVEHEISHIIFNSSIEVFRQKVFSKIPIYFEQIARALFNTFEDSRVDSLWDAVHSGSKVVRKVQAKVAKNEMLKNFNQSDVEMLMKLALADSILGENSEALFDAKYKIAYNVIRKYCDFVKMKSIEASIYATFKALKAIVNLYKQNYENLSNLDSKTINQIERELSVEAREIIKNEQTKNELFEISKNLKPFELQIFKSVETTDVDFMSEKEIEKLSSEKGQQEIEKFMKMKAQKSKTVEYKVVNDWQYFCKSKIEPDIATAQRIRSLFMKLECSECFSDEGIDFDSDEFIQRYITKDNRQIFLDERRQTKKVSIVVLIDGSRSMTDYIQQLKKTVLTIYEATKNLKNVNISFIIFSEIAKTIYVYEFKTASELRNFSLLNNTPTFAGIDFAVEKLMKQSASKKMIILLTDGVPNSDVVENPTKETIRAIKSAEKAGIPVKILFILSEKDEENLEKYHSSLLSLFGTERIRKVEEIPRKLYKFVVEEVVKELK